MTTELSMLAASTALYFILNFAIAKAVVAPRYIPWALGDRDERSAAGPCADSWLRGD